MLSIFQIRYLSQHAHDSAATPLPGYRRWGWSLCCTAVLLAGASGCASSFSNENALPPSAVAPVSYDNPGDEEINTLELEDFSPSNVYDATLAATGFGPDPEEARTLYQQADDYYAQAVNGRQRDPRGSWSEDFVQAGLLYAEAAKQWPESALEQDALFRAGESYFFANNYPDANEQFEELLIRYPNSKYIDLVQARRFAIADFWLKEDEQNPDKFYTFNLFNETRPLRDSRGNALRIFKKIPLDDPTGKLADDAMIAAANAHFASGNFAAADQTYDDLRKMFPSSEHQFLAHFMGIKTKLVNYQGADYSGDALIQAEELLDQVRKQFPQEAAQNREVLDHAHREIRYRLAEREWTMARFYDRRWEYGAARYYYDVLVRKFGDTPFADRATVRISEIADQPDTPEQRMAWLVDLFPNESDTSHLIR